MNTETQKFVEESAGRIRQENTERIEAMREIHGDAVADAVTAMSDAMTLAAGVLRMGEHGNASLQDFLARLMAHDLMSQLLGLTSYHVRAAHSLNESQWEFVKTAAKEISQHVADGAVAVGATLDAMREAQNSEALQ